MLVQRCNAIRYSYPLLSTLSIFLLSQPTLSPLFFFGLTCHFQSSENGSPVERIDEGAIVATVCKKRKGNGAGGASVEINVGDGRIISLSNPGNVRELDSGMKATAASQLKVLADQMASLMAQLQS